MCSIIKMGGNLESDRYKIRAVLWVTGDPCKIAVNGFDSHTVHQTKRLTYMLFSIILITVVVTILYFSDGPGSGRY